MGRQTWILHTSINDDAEGEIVMTPDPVFVMKMVEKYNLSEYSWRFDDTGNVTFRESYGKCYVYGEIDDHIKALLETAKELNHKICGTLSYVDDQTGGSFHGIIYIAKNYTALHHEFFTDVNVETLEELGEIHTVRKITL